MKARTIYSALLIAFYSSSSLAATAINADQFVDTIGVGTHMSYGWANNAYFSHVPQVIADLKYMGINNVRDADYPVASLNAMGAAGIKFDIIGAPALTAMPSYFKTLDTYQKTYPGMVAAIEGPNEITSTYSWSGLTGQLAANGVQKALYANAKADPLLSKTLVYDYTTVDPTVITTRAGAAEFTNQHIYPQNGNQPGNYWINWGLNPGKRLEQFNLPDVMTEFGYNTKITKGWYVIGIDEPSQAKGILNGLFDAVRQGVKRTYIYELCDEYPDPDYSKSSEYHYGLFHNDHSPKASATTLHNLTTILKSNSTVQLNKNANATLNYSIANPGKKTYSLLLQKDDGTFLIALWNEVPFWKNLEGTPINSAPVNMTLNLGATASQVNIFDPTHGTTPTLSQQNVATLSVPVPDHVIFVSVVLSDASSLQQNLATDTAAYNTAKAQVSFYAKEYSTLSAQGRVLNAQSVQLNASLAAANAKLSADKKTKATANLSTANTTSTLASDQASVVQINQSITQYRTALTAWKAAFSTHHQNAIAAQAKANDLHKKVVADQAALKAHS